MRTATGWKFAFYLAALSVLGVATPTVVSAKGCGPGTAFVPKWGCVAKTEIAKAKQYCKKFTKDFRECLCQDGAKIGACGN